MASMRTYPGDGEGEFRLDHFREGVTVAHVVWRDQEGNAHERVTCEEVRALALLDWVARHPRMTLVSFEMN